MLDGILVRKNNICLIAYQLDLRPLNNCDMKEISSRTKYIRPIIVSVALSVIGEFGLFVSFGLILFPEGSWLLKLLWTVVFCGLGMGAVLGGFINLFIIDRFDGKKAIWLCTVASLVIIGTLCDLLCYYLDLEFNYFGGGSNGFLFHASSWLLAALGGYLAGWLLFSDRGNSMLKRMKI